MMFTIKMSKREIFTIGYEGLHLEEFINRLKDFEVEYLIDVREIPLSRKKGFSKSALKTKLESENMHYVHLRLLGSPSHLRQKLRSDSDYESFFRAYFEHLSGNQDSIAELYGYISLGVTCIMCFEKEPDRCHRSLVARKIKEYDGNGLKVINI